MKGFAIDENGDIIIENNDIRLTNGDDLIRQNVEKLIGTNKGEWFLNKNEGINFKTILKKNPNMDIVRNEILTALQSIDNTFYFEEFNYVTEERKLYIDFVAKNKDGQTVRGSNKWD